MFTIAFRRLYFASDKIIVRHLRNSRIPTGPNPGMQKRIVAFQQEGFKIQDEDAEEFVEQSESDFYKVGKADVAHVKETLAGKLELRHKIIKEKYFKEHMPNLLTWSEKEQIRHLAQTQPDEWTPERIAESFPVTVPVVKKLLKYPWKPATKERIARHDESAMRNWKELKEGTLNIPADLREHFLKFSERTIPPLNQKSLKVDLTPETSLNNMKEFESIIRRCAAKDEQSKQQERNQEETTEETDLTVIEKKNIKKDFKRVTLDELADRIQKRLEKGKDLEMNDSIMLTTVKSNTENQLQHSQELSDEIVLAMENSKSSEMAKFKEKIAQVAEVDFTKRIRIPKKAYKKGATYKVNDCYYDEDGKFLYRVLGMTN